MAEAAKLIGLGAALALDLASRGCKVIIADKENAEPTVNHIIKTTHNPAVSYKHLDLRSFENVRLFAADIKCDVSRLDILICNAAITNLEYEKTEDGIQNIMQINFFSQFLLVLLLLDLLLKSAPSRILFTSSIAIFFENLNLENLIGEIPQKRSISMSGTYGNSKIAFSIAMQKLAQKLKGTGVTANFYHPGFIPTSLLWQPFTLSFWDIWDYWIVIAVAYFFGKTIEEGIQVMRYVAYSDEVSNITGEFFIDGVKIPLPKKMRNRTFCENVWKMSEEIVRLTEEEKIDFVLERHNKSRVS